MKRLIKRVIHRLSWQCFRAKFTDPREMREMWHKAKVCCVVSSSGIGDSLMATPLIEAIRRCKPTVQLVLVCSDKTAQVFKTNPHVDTILTYVAEKYDILGFSNLLFKLLTTRIDVLFGAQPSNTIRHSLIAGFSGARLRLKHTYDYGTAHERDFSFVYNSQVPNNLARHRTELNLDLLRLLGEEIAERSIYPRYSFSNNAQRRIEQWLSTAGHDGDSGGLFALHPGGVRKNKRWMAERFAEVGRELSTMGFSVCLVGGRDEKDLCDQIIGAISMPRSFNAAGMFSLEETAALLSNCQCLISNDTGVMHLATAINTPVVAVFGPTDSRHIGPFSTKATVLHESKDVQDVSPPHVLRAALSCGEQISN